jgi:hypothetical protein
MTEEDDDSEVDYEDIDSLQDIEEYVQRIRPEKTDDEKPVDKQYSYDPKLTSMDEDQPDIPEPLNAALLKYQIMAEVNRGQRDFFDSNVAFFGTHVVNSNTKRIDNLRHLDEIDLSNGYRDIPYMRERATEIKLKATSEFQMCRSNQEIGGFDRKMQYTNIRRDEVDVKQQQSIFRPGKKKTGILGIFSRKKEGV